MIMLILTPCKRAVDLSSLSAVFKLHWRFGGKLSAGWSSCDCLDEDIRVLDGLTPPNINGKWQNSIFRLIVGICLKNRFLNANCP
jgi:hypothetical protein